jgi:hypothetical protein
MFEDKVLRDLLARKSVSVAEMRMYLHSEEMCLMFSG